MIYRRLSRGEMLKALQEHATFRSHDHSAVMRWDERAGAYYIIGNGMCIAVDAFEEFTGMSTMIRMSASLKMSEEKKINVMIGTLTVHDWFVEILEEGEEESA